MSRGGRKKERVETREANGSVAYELGRKCVEANGRIEKLMEGLKCEEKVG